MNIIQRAGLAAGSLAIWSGLLLLWFEVSGTTLTVINGCHPGEVVCPIPYTQVLTVEGATILAVSSALVLLSAASNRLWILGVGGAGVSLASLWWFVYQDPAVPIVGNTSGLVPGTDLILLGAAISIATSISIFLMSRNGVAPVGPVAQIVPFKQENAR